MSTNAQYESMRLEIACLKRERDEARRERDALQAAVDAHKGTDVHHLRGCVNVLASKLAYYTGKTVPTEITGAESVLEQLAEARATCLDASKMINTVMERRDGELTGTAWGDLDNVRLDLMRAAEAGGEHDNVL